MEPVYLVDGSGYIFRAFYAVPPGLTTKDGFPTNALTGFARMVHKLIRQSETDCIAVAFDTKEPTFRHVLYDQYKANRAECPAELVPQMPVFREIVRALGLKSLELPGVEADDIIATLALRLKALGQQVIIVSGDKDLTQLVCDEIQVWDGMRDITYDAAAVREKFGVEPNQIRDFLAITGDSSDNVPGLKGVGPKGAQKLLEHFGSLDRVLANPQEIESIPGLRGARSIREKVETGLEQLALSQQLVSLKEDVEPFVHIQSARELDRDQPDQAVLRALYERLEFGSLLRSLQAAEGGGAAGDDSVQAAPNQQSNKEPRKDQTSKTRPPTPPPTGHQQGSLFDASPFDLSETEASEPAQTSAPIGVPEGKEYVLVTRSSFADFFAQLSSVTCFAFDTETTSLDVRSAELLGISFSWKFGEAYYVPLGSKLAESHERGEVNDPTAVRAALGPIFSNPQIKKVGLNLKFDQQVLQENGYTVEGVAFDAMLCAYVIDPDRRDTGLKQLARIHLGEQMRTYADLVGAHEHLGFVPVAEVAQYACHDADASWGLYERLNPKLGPETGGLSRTGDENQSIVADKVEGVPRLAFEQIEMPLVPVLAEMERTGILVDIPFLQSLEKEFSAEAEVWQVKAQELAGQEFNVNSPKQLATILFDNMGVSTVGVKKTKTGYSTDASVLEKLAGDYEIARVILEYRELHKLISTYVQALQRLVHPVTGRIHGSFNQAIAATGRLSSSDPNLQNIPIRNPRGRRIRQAFVAAPNCLILSADYSQIELRILAHLSDDKNLQQAFIDGEDIHERTAREIFGELRADDEERDRLRRIAKTINFGVVYGISAFRLSGDLGVSRKQAQDYIDGYFARYPKVRVYYDHLKRQLEHSGYVSTLFGHRRYRETLQAEGRDAGYIERSMLNAPIQGTAAEVIKLAMVRLQHSLPGTPGDPRREPAKMVLQVHDELVFEVAAERIEEIRGLVVLEMERAVAMAVPLRVDTEVGTTWG